jgi:antitoxin ChpS
MKHEARLRKVGGSVMVSVPPALLDELRLGPDSKVDLRVSNGRLVVEPQARPKYTLDELLARCDRTKPVRKDREWLSGKRIGRELI